MKLKGKYGPHDTVNEYNGNKEAFRKDAMAFLRALQKELGWVTRGGKHKGPRFHASGPATSGDATVTLFPSPDAPFGVYVTIGATLRYSNSTESGASIMWRTASAQDTLGARSVNRYPDADVTVADLARTLRFTVDRIVPAAS